MDDVTIFPTILTAGGVALTHINSFDNVDISTSSALEIHNGTLHLTPEVVRKSNDQISSQESYNGEEDDCIESLKGTTTFICTDDIHKGVPSSLQNDLSSFTIPSADDESSSRINLLWLVICFFGIMLSFVGYGLLLEYTTSAERKLHELSFLFVTSLFYTITAATGRYVRDESPTTIPPSRFVVLGMTSMGSTFCSVRSLRYVIYPIQVLAKSCKPIPVMFMGALMGKKYQIKKYINVVFIVCGVGLFMGGGDTSKKHSKNTMELSSTSQVIGIILLFISLCFDGGTGAYEDKLMALHSVGPFDLMYNIQLGKTIIAGVGLLVLNQVHVFLHMCQEMGFVLVALGFTGAMGQVFIFITISKFGALTCSIIGLARKITTLVASLYFYGHLLNGVQMVGLVICICAMVLNFWGVKEKGNGGHAHPPPKKAPIVSVI